MNIVYRITLFFKATFGGGWSETWYRLSPASAAEVMQSVLIGGGLFQSRRQMLAQAYTIAYVRVSNADRPRDGLVFAAPGTTGQGLAPGVVGTNEQSFDAVNVRYYAGPSRWRSMLFRGLPQGTFVGNILDAGGPFLAALPLFSAVLMGGYSLQRWDEQALRTDLVSVQIDFNRITSLTGAGALPLAVEGDTMLVKGARGISFINGRYKIKSISGTRHYVASKRFNAYGTLSALNPGVLIRLVPTYPVITGAAVVGPTSRRTGRPSYQPRGARPARQP